MKLKPLIARRLRVSPEAVKAVTPWRGKPTITQLKKTLLALGVASSELVVKGHSVIMLSTASRRGQLFQAA